MARRSKYIKKLTSKDIAFIKQLARTGMASREQISVNLKLSTDRLKKLENSLYISSKNVVVNGQQRVIYMLDNKGKKHCKNELAISYFAKAQTNHVKHDLKLTEMYYNMPDNVKETWKSENQIVYEHKRDNNDITINTCVDATVELDGNTIAIEAIGSSYTKETIEEKKSIATNILKCSDILMV